MKVTYLTAILFLAVVVRSDEMTQSMMVTAATPFDDTVLSEAGMGQDFLPLPAVKTYYEDYQVQLEKEKYCPNAPSEEAVECARTYDLSQSVQQVLRSPEVEVQTKKYNELLKVTKCTMDKVPTLNASLEVYCYIKGVKQSMLKEFSELRSLQDYNDLLIQLEKMIEEDERPSFVEFLNDLKDSLETLRSDIEAIEKVDVQNMTGRSSEFNRQVVQPTVRID